MLQSAVQEPVSGAKKVKEENILKTESSKIENYSNLIFQIVSELGFLIPDNVNGNDPLSQKYQPSLKYRECLRDLQKVLFKVFNENMDIFDIIRCRIGEWKFMNIHFLPLLISLIQSSPHGNTDIFILLEIINSLIFSIDEDDSVKPAYFSDLCHHNCLYKKLLSHKAVMGALTLLMASSLSSINKDDLNLDPVKMIARLLNNALSCPEKQCNGGNQIQNLAYGKKETIISSMAKSKMIDLIFTLSSSSSDRKLFNPAHNDVSAIFEDILCIISTIFECIEVSDLFIKKVQIAVNDGDSAKVRKPIRHGRFSGSVSVQLSTGENIIINNSNMFVSGIPGTLDSISRKNTKLETRMEIQTSKKTNLSTVDRDLFLKLSTIFLESHFNALFGPVCSKKTVFELMNQHQKYLIQISKYFIEFCRISFLSSQGKSNQFNLIFGALDIKYMLENIDYLHEVISSKNYPLMLKLLPYIREVLSMIMTFESSNDQLLLNISKNIQKQLLHSKNVLLLIRRVIMIAKPVAKYFLQICIESGDAILKLTKRYSDHHKYWYVSSLSCSEIFSRDNDSESYEDFNVGHESNFNFESLLKHFSARDVVDFYCNAIGNCGYQSKELNSMVARYFYYLVKSEYNCKALMRPSVIVLLQRVITGSPAWKNQNQELLKVSNKIIRKYSSTIIADPYQLILSFFN